MYLAGILKSTDELGSDIARWGVIIYVYYTYLVMTHDLFGLSIGRLRKGNALRKVEWSLNVRKVRDWRPLTITSGLGLWNSEKRTLHWIIPHYGSLLTDFTYSSITIFSIIFSLGSSFCFIVVTSGVVVEIYFIVGPVKVFLTERTFFFSNSSSWNCPVNTFIYEFQCLEQDLSISSAFNTYAKTSSFRFQSVWLRSSVLPESFGDTSLS